MTRRVRLAATAVALLALTGLASPASAQTPREWWSIDLTQAALKLMEAAGANASSRIGVLPIAVSDAGLTRLADDVTSQLIWALQSVPHAASRGVEPIERPVVRRANSVTALTERLPLSASEAANAGRAASAAFVVTGEVMQSRSDLPSRVELALVDVRSGDTVGTANASFTFPGTPSIEGSRPFWKSRAFVGATGAAAMLLTSFAALRANHDLKVKNAELLEIPAGATTEWARVHDEAAGISKERDFWWGVTIGLAGVTTSYVAIAGSPQIALTRPGRAWQVAVNPTSRGVSVARSF